MEGELKSALSVYLGFVAEGVVRSRDEETNRKGFIVLRSQAQEFRSFAEEAEGSGLFDRLVHATEDAFSHDQARRGSSKWRSHVQNFLRRNGIYRDALAGNTVDIASLEWQYEDAFTRDQNTITYFAPLEFISFAEERMDFGDFEIRRFRKDELDQKFQQATCPTFYPWTTVDTQLLSQYWFLTCSEDQPSPKPGSMKVTLNFGVAPKYSHFPEPIEAALK